jgi:copper chaperone CopZ
METRSVVVTGMTCEHCARAVRAEVGALAGVAEVQVDVAGGTVRISGAPLPGDEALRDAVAEAGYQLVG